MYWLKKLKNAVLGFQFAKRRGISVNSIVGIAVGLLIVSALIPSAITAFLAVNTTAWDTSLSAMWDVVPLMAIVGLVIGFVAYAKSR